MNSGRKIAEGGSTLALYCVLLFITVQIPLLGILTIFFLPIPFILVTIKQKFRGVLVFYLLPRYCRFYSGRSCLFR